MRIPDTKDNYVQEPDRITRQVPRTFGLILDSLIVCLEMSYFI